MSRWSRAEVVLGASPEPIPPWRRVGRVLTALVAAAVLVSGTLGAYRSSREGVSTITGDLDAGNRAVSNRFLCLSELVAARVPEGATVYVAPIPATEDVGLWVQRIPIFAFEHATVVDDPARAEWVLDFTAVAPTEGCTGYTIRLTAGGGAR